MISTEKNSLYIQLVEQARALVENEFDEIANMANVAALIHNTFHFWWTGFYRLVGDDLVLGPFQGPIACTRIKRGRGVCGAARERRETVVVPDVEQFPGHIACSSASRSEIVVPVFDSEGNVKAVLDIDSEHLATFDDVDARYLEQIAALFRN
ncbi:MAG: GAF domain-containing protein [Bacteroidaceae bacterium]|nr:GAF domain-containing protein [Bacteroidaceae bacterium]